MPAGLQDSDNKEGKVGKRGQQSGSGSGFVGRNQKIMRFESRDLQRLESAAKSRVGLWQSVVPNVQARRALSEKNGREISGGIGNRCEVRFFQSVPGQPDSVGAIEEERPASLRARVANG